MIEVKNLVKRFGGFTAVDNVSFTVKNGDIFAFLGPNGAGKTTTIKMLTTLLKPTSGEILINGNDPTKDQDEVRRSFGIVFQDPSLDDELTAYENMQFHGILYGVPKKIREERIEQLMKFVELWDRRNDLVKHFSGGMKRRLEVARGLIHHPKILFLDEPTLGLDPHAEPSLELYKEFKQRKGNDGFLHDSLYGRSRESGEESCDYRQWEINRPGNAKRADGNYQIRKFGRLFLGFDRKVNPR